MMLALQVHVQLGESEENIFVYAVTSFLVKRKKKD
jgi:hypothetical protein